MSLLQLTFHANSEELHFEFEFRLKFTATHIPEDFGQVDSFFQRRGAYAKFKNLLNTKGLLAEWYEFEEQEQVKALKEWCKDNGINIDS